MARFLFLFVLTQFCVGAEAGPWRPLLQKNNFVGWRSPSGHTPIEGAWTISRGVLTAKPYVQHRTDLWSEEEYENFELEWEWRAAKGANSGVKYWVEDALTLVVIQENVKWRQVKDPREAPAETTIEYTRGLEYQLADDAHEPDAVKRPEARAGGLYGLMAPTVMAAKAHDHWNRSRIVVRDGHFQHWLNGKQTLSVEWAAVEGKLRMPLTRRRGPLALQYHQTVVSFRKLRVRRL